MAYSYIIYIKYRTLFTFKSFEIFRTRCQSLTVFKVPLVRIWFHQFNSYIFVNHYIKYFDLSTYFPSYFNSRLSRLIPLKITIVLSVILETLYYYPYINTWWEFIPAFILASKCDLLIFKIKP